MKTATIISGAAIVLSTISSAAPTSFTDISKRSVQSERGASANAEASPSTLDASSLEKKEAQESTVEVRTEILDADMSKRQNTTAITPPELDSPDACIIM